MWPLDLLTGSHGRECTYFKLRLLRFYRAIVSKMTSLSLTMTSTHTCRRHESQERLGQALRAVQDAYSKEGRGCRGSWHVPSVDLNSRIEIKGTYYILLGNRTTVRLVFASGSAFRHGIEFNLIVSRPKPDASVFRQSALLTQLES